MSRALRLSFFSLVVVASAAISFGVVGTVVAEEPTAAHLRAPGETALDRYVAKPDTTFEWKLLQKIDGPTYTGYIVDLTSQTWRTDKDVDRQVWRHWLTIIQPREVTTDTAFLFIGGGNNKSEPPKGISPLLGPVAVQAKSVVAELQMIPNQPLTFMNDGKPRSEDDLLAYTWKKFIETGDEEWPARLAMVKSVVRAMDTMQALMGSDEGGNTPIEEFIVAGGSKRGWTTWLTGAVDTRVRAICPLVIDVLNMQESMNHHFAAYGFWAPAVGDYVNHGLMEPEIFFNPRYEELMQIEDPFRYRHRLTMPKYIVNAAGDEFFLPDSSQFYFDELEGEKYLRYVPNASHSLAGSDAPQTVLAWYHSVINDHPRPKFSWTFEEDGSIRVETEDQPDKVVLWQAHNPESRDFRLEKIGKAYKSTQLSPESEGVFVGRVEDPTDGFKAFFVELTYASALPGLPMKFTTSVRVLPDVLPYVDQAPLALEAAAAGN